MTKACLEKYPTSRYIIVHAKILARARTSNASNSSHKHSVMVCRLCYIRYLLVLSRSPAIFHISPLMVRTVRTIRQRTDHRTFFSQCSARVLLAWGKHRFHKAPASLCRQCVFHAGRTSHHHHRLRPRTTLWAQIVPAYEIRSGGVLGLSPTAERELWACLRYLSYTCGSLVENMASCTLRRCPVVGERQNRLREVLLGRIRGSDDCDSRHKILRCTPLVVEASVPAHESDDLRNDPRQSHDGSRLAPLRPGHHTCPWT